MKVILMNGDYEIYLSQRDMKKATTRQSSTSLSSYPLLFGKVIDDKNKKIKGKLGGLALLCTNESDVIYNETAYGGILFERDEFGPLVRIYTPNFVKLMEGELEFLTTRYDGTNKVFIRRAA